MNNQKIYGLESVLVQYLAYQKCAARQHGGAIEVPAGKGGGITMLKKNIIDLLQIRHHNGGNYHAVVRLHLIGDEDGVYCVILEETTTREEEEFPGDRYEILIFHYGEFHLGDKWLVKGKENKIVNIEGFPVRFRQGEAEIVWQNPQAFIEARKPRAEEFATIAKAFGHEDAKWEDFLLYV